MKNPIIISQGEESDKSEDGLILSRSEQRMRDFTESLISEPPYCPECHKIMRLRDLTKCSYCGFHFGYLEKIFPQDLPSLESLTDFTNHFSEQDRASILSQIDTIQTRYPQLYIKIAILPLQPSAKHLSWLSMVSKKWNLKWSFLMTKNLLTKNKLKTKQRNRPVELITPQKKPSSE